MTSKMMKGLGIGAAIFGFLASQFWGVPYYISVKVEEEVKAISASAGTPTEVTELTTKMAGVEAGILRLDGTAARVEGKIDNLTALITEDFRRRAERGEQ